MSKVEIPKIERQIGNDKLLERYKRYLRFKIEPDLNRYFSNLQERLLMPEIEGRAKESIFEIIYRNNLMGHILSSKEFNLIVDEEKSLKGECKIGVVTCIDGRISGLHKFGRTANIKEIAGSLINLSDLLELDDLRFIRILEQSADEGRELLEIVTAHTGKHHKCGAIEKGIEERVFQGDPDQVAIEEAKKRAEAIEKKYNQILTAKNKQPQNKVSITAMIDTDHMGLILNYGQENELSTTDITLQLLDLIKSGIGKNVGEFGSMKETFARPELFLEYSKKILEITRFIINNRVFDDYINNNYPQLSDNQKKALIFTLSRTVANQYLTGLASEEEFDHPYSEHNERYLSVSPHGKLFGRFDMQQVFGSVPSNRQDMLSHIKTKLSILDSNNAIKPYILFLSMPTNETEIVNSASTLLASENALTTYFSELFKDEQIKKLIEDGQLIIIPIYIEENNGKLISVRDYSFYI